MDNIKVAQVPDVTLIRLGVSNKGTLHLTTHHMIFKQNDNGREMWICYPIIFEVIRQPFNPFMGYSRIGIACRDYTFLTFHFSNDSISRDVYESLQNLTSQPIEIERLYAFLYKPGSLERSYNGWKIYNPIKEYERMGAINGEDSKWRISEINKDYNVSKTYPSIIVVPSSISDTVLNYGAKYRSKNRLPALSYYHKFNKCTITRCSQPLVSLKKNRSVQDEKLILSIFSTTTAPEGVVANQQENIIVDARPTANALAQVALGGGSEFMDNYKPAKKYYLGIDNIHVMRDSMNKVIDAIRNGDVSNSPPNHELLVKSHWLKHVATLLKGAVLTAQQVHYKFSHVLVHCSDGWDRTPQLTGLAMIMLDPYFRTIDGFIVLVEKEWISFGHKFAERSHIPATCKVKEFSLSQQQEVLNGEITSDFVNGLNSGSGGGSSNNSNSSRSNFLNNVTNLLPDSTNKANKYGGPIFQQFLDCIFQIICQFPNKFEYNERFLRRLLYHVFSCQYGTFLFNSEYERVKVGVDKKSRSVWDYFLARRKQFTNPNYVKDESNNIENSVIFPDATKVKWWAEVLGRSDEEMNIKIVREAPSSIVEGDGGSQDFLTAFQSMNFNSKYGRYKGSDGGGLDSSSSTSLNIEKDSTERSILGTGISSGIGYSSTPDLNKDDRISPIVKDEVRKGNDGLQSTFPSEGFGKYVKEEKKEKEEEKEEEKEKNNRNDAIDEPINNHQAELNKPILPNLITPQSPSSPNSSYEPLGNTLVTYDHENDDYYPSPTKKFDTMALDLSANKTNTSYPTRQFSRGATALADGATAFAGGATALAEDLFGRFTKGETARSDS